MVIENEVSIVIVSMNRMDNLNICLPSIEKYTKCKHKIYVVAYMFSKENLAELREKYPQVIIVESNEIRGFSENNNLALRQVTSEFVFIQNDDTEYKEPVLDKLLEAYKQTPKATIMSPKLLLGNGTVQFNGRRKFNYWTFMLGVLSIRKLPKSKYENKEGIFLSYNISGAAFLIKTEDFRRIGFFDEKYFFSPEDTAVSTKINRNGGYCYTDANSSIVHYHGVSSRKTKLFYATTCSAYLGMYLFYCDTTMKQSFYKILLLIKIIVMSLVNVLLPSQHKQDYIYVYKKLFYAIRCNQTPKQLFLEEYNLVRNIK